MCAECSEVDVNKASLSGITSLLMIVEIGWSDILDILLQDGAIVDLTYSGKRAEGKKIADSIPLIGATKYNSAKLALTMNLCRQISLFCAVQEGRIDIAQYLLDRGADPGVQNHYEVSAL
ncbi:unnamed protein product [Rotaria sp. Silwood2]|nr:unnamed protein product [Rotaria sp. Silwood2]CAF4361646.1 unnamed protein product [Rotaria sp. Silwood2]